MIAAMSSALHVVRCRPWADGAVYSRQRRRPRDVVDPAGVAARASDSRLLPTIGGLMRRPSKRTPTMRLKFSPGSARSSSARALVRSIALELVRTRPELAAGADPDRAADGRRRRLQAATAAFLAEFDRRVAEQGGPAAGEFFLRTVLGDAAFERMPRSFQDRSKQKWAEIRADSRALLAYQPRYRELAHVDVPVLLLGGDRSAPYFRPTLDALAATLPRVRLEIVRSAGHMLHVDAHRRFADLLTDSLPARAAVGQNAPRCRCSRRDCFARSAPRPYNPRHDNPNPTCSRSHWQLVVVAARSHRSSPARTDHLDCATRSDRGDDAGGEEGSARGRRPPRRRRPRRSSSSAR